jgi:hypothetical protein
LQLFISTQRRDGLHILVLLIAQLIIMLLHILLLLGGLVVAEAPLMVALVAGVGRAELLLERLISLLAHFIL